MRLFLAIPLPDAVRAALGRLQGDLRVGRHVDPENLHVTLAFLDDQSLATAELVHERLCEIALSGAEIRIRGLDVFGGRNPRVVFAGVEKTGALDALREKVRTAVRAAEVALPRERFRPHVTLARFPKPMPRHELDKLGAFLEAHGDFALDPFDADRVTLFRSRLGPQGPDYEALSEYPLG
ncbi:RNA 2',3'-cyclic phosphodiesterase [Roseovarius salinarum]|uniref:RNA 2',3'-cyclic phosphodiesterase n=1 Tax=Roseovarius salinarum TaxID=1981892 RepID=UPI000C3478F9|nr:RNA 2',3'-cyclic phosphodiesterase [Roseovarius salinarum]